jgi:transcriptional regulator with XRE-family HTH domain
MWSTIKEGLGSMTNEHIGNRIRKLRQEKNLSQKEFANALGFNSPATVSAWENGKGQLSSDIIIAIAGYFGVSTDYLLVGHDRNDPEETLLRNLLKEVRIFEDLDWNGFRPLVFVVALTFLTMIIAVFKHAILEYVTLFLFVTWLVVFFVYSIKVLVSPFRPSKSVFIHDSKSYVYASSLSELVMKKRKRMQSLLIMSGAVLSLVNVVLTILLVPSFRIPLTGNLYVLFSLLSLAMMVYQYFRVGVLKGRDDRLDLKDFNAYASIDSHTIDLLLAGLTFMALFGYAILYAKDEQIVLLHTTIALLGLRFNVSLAIYALHRNLIETYAIKETLDR